MNDKKVKIKYSKAYGLKSTIAVDNNIYMTTYGKGSEAIIDKKLSNGKIIDYDNSKLDVEYEFDDISLKVKDNTKYAINNPLKDKKVGADYLGLKDNLEMDFFGKNYNDNIHIQIIYNILDIKKILSLYYYNIVYSINNLKRDKEKYDTPDDIGMFDTIEPYPGESKNKKIFEKINKYAEPYFSYYGSVFKIQKPKNKDEENKISPEQEKRDKEKKDKHNYYVIQALSSFRNLLAHDGQKTLYSNNLDFPQGVIEVINGLFEKDMININKDFTKHSKMNLYIIGNYFLPHLSTDELVTRYYRFSIFKDNKNIGINVKKIREKMYEYDYVDYEGSETYKPKLNNIIDFLIFNYIHYENKHLEDEVVEKLRKTLTEKEKEELYKKLAFELSKKSKGISDVNRKIKMSIKNKYSKDKYDDAFEKIKGIGKFDSFSKCIYFISKFFEGKEINEIYSSLINKFDNIHSLIKTLKNDLNEPVVFAEKYGLFNKDLGIIADELRLCRSIVKMEKNVVPSKRLYMDALTILKVKDEIVNDEESCKQMLDGFLNRKKKDHKLRNFIINNVINSKRFIYVIKYMNPSHCLTFIQNKNIVNFVLKEIPDEQIERYYDACHGKISISIDQKRDALANDIKKLNFFDIEEKEYLMKDNKSRQIEELKRMLGLYLTVIYLIAKNLVKINSMYCIALSMFERDYYYFNNKVYDEQNPLCLIEMRLIDDKNDDKHKRYKAYDTKWIEQNICTFNKLSEEWKMSGNKDTLFRYYRNKIIHLNFVDRAHKYIKDVYRIDSYFDLYHHIVQKDLLNQVILEKTSLFSSYSKMQPYSKDMLKIINMPFVYNLARYKNLTISDLFYDKY